jgi:hypothetical protein
MYWILGAFLAAFTAIMIISIASDHRAYKLKGYKRMVVCPEMILLTDRYINMLRSSKFEFSRRLLSYQIGGLMKNRGCQVNDLIWPWSTRFFFTAKKGEMVIDFPLANTLEEIRKGKPKLAAPIVMFKKGKVSFFERCRFSGEMIDAINLHTSK